MRPTETLTGTLLGERYVLNRPLGAGGSATVYLADDVSLRREVAVKVLRTGLTADDAFLRRFRAEAVAVAALNHPHILSVFDWGEADGDAWLVTEYLAGGSLRDLLDHRGTLSIEQVASIGMQAADGLAYAHSRGIVHRDVKPANLLFDDAGRVRIADFGVARALAEAAWTEPEGGLIGTVRYTSPEQAMGLAVDGKSDVYSLALVLYECVTGEVPFTADTQVATLHGRVGASLPSNPMLGPLAGVLAAAAAPDREARLDAGALLERLTELSRRLPDPAPLRIARRAATIGFHPPTPEQLTGTHRAVAPAPWTAPAAAASDLTEVRGAPREDATIVTGIPTVRASASGPRRRRRALVLGVVIAILLAAVAAFALTRPVAAPTFPTPNVIGMPVSVVTADLAKHQVHVRVDHLGTSKRFAAGEVIKQHPPIGAPLKEGGTLDVVQSSGPPLVRIPAVVGFNCAHAIATLATVGFAASCPVTLAVYSTALPVGHAIAIYDSNTPNPHAAPFGATLSVQLSKGPPPIPVPNVVMLPVDEATTTLQRAGFVTTVTKAFSSTVKAGLVISTTPPPSGPLQPGGTVTVVESKGVGVAVPAIGNVSLHEAERILLDAGLNVTVGRVSHRVHRWVTQPVAGTVVALGSTVLLIAR